MQLSKNRENKWSILTTTKQTFLQEKQTSDWRKNVEDKAGMDGRKKMFETEA